MLTYREINARYRGSVLGIFWSLLTPLFLLLIYTFVFGTVFRSRWPAPEGTPETSGLSLFAVILFTGLVTFQLFADVVTRAPGLIASHRNYVTRIVFPLHILPLVQLGAALFQYMVSMSVLLMAIALTLGYIPPTLIWLPVIVLPFCLLIAGLAWIFAAIGPYFKDIGQILGTVVSALMFLAPIFFSRSVLPDFLQFWVLLNPVTVPVEQSRLVLIYGTEPNFIALLSYSVCSGAVFLSGLMCFSRLRWGFSDVL